ncbi:GNAT family N-acetyltransferase [Micromonospora sp. BRA006-A]|nr:GNAT family N-acetyltransferase [Micromonospora sp. BRA006-A]
MDLARADVLARLERFYDAVPRDGARTEDHGALVLFVRDGAGWPFYARPRLDATDAPTLADVTAVRARQRELGLPEAFEWVHEHQPDLLAVARSAGLSVLEAPLMPLEPERLPDPGRSATYRCGCWTPATPASRRTSRCAGRSRRSASPTAAPRAATPDRPSGTPASPSWTWRRWRRRRPGSPTGGASRCSPRHPTRARSPAGWRCGSATWRRSPGWPRCRPRGSARLGAAVTATLARQPRAAGTDLIFLSAGSEDIARVYLRVGFRRIGTACIAEPAAVI